MYVLFCSVMVNGRVPTPVHYVLEQNKVYPFEVQRGLRYICVLV